MYKYGEVIQVSKDESNIWKEKKFIAYSDDRKGVWCISVIDKASASLYYNHKPVPLPLIKDCLCNNTETHMYSIDNYYNLIECKACGARTTKISIKREVIETWNRMNTLPKGV